VEKGLVLGLDLGPNSVGWALVEAGFDDGDNQVAETGIVATGVRVFEEGLDNFDSSKEESRSQKRRMARGARRTHQRRARRKRKVRRLLQSTGLLPASPEALHRLVGPFPKGAKPIDPYEARARGLDERLHPHELGVVFYHFAVRRGFKSNRKDAGNSKEEGNVKGAIAELRRAMEASGARTLGEYLFRLRAGDHGTIAAERQHGGQMHRLRNRFTARGMYRDEFEAIVAAQRAFHEPLADSQFVGRLREAIFHQRPYGVTPERVESLQKQANGRPRFANLLRSPSIGACPLEPDEVRMPRGHWLAQRFRLLKEVNNLGLIARSERPLKPEERDCVVAALESHKSQKFDQLRKALGLHEFVRFNLEAGGRKALDGNVIEDAIAKAVGRARWRRHARDERGRIGIEVSEILLDEEDRDQARERIVSAFATNGGLDPETAGKLAGFHPGDSYIAYSRRAVERLLPHLEGGLDEYEAIRRAYPDRPQAATVNRLPPPSGSITNPIVRRALTEARKVVNAILREYGRPARIVVETAREVAQGPKRRREFTSRMREREQARNELRTRLETEFGVPNPDRDLILRYELWEEQDGRCPYSGRGIEVAAVVSGGGDLQVDHILPRWRSLDDTRANKVLTFADINREKGDRTPWEWCGDTPAFDEMAKRIERLRRMPLGKKRRFLQKELAADGFVQRQLNDTRYIAREVVGYLNRLYPPEQRVGEKAVRSSPGRLTAELRRCWGLNNIFTHWQGPAYTGEKIRDDFRHHAVDALVVALSTRRHLARYARFRRAVEEGLVDAAEREVEFDPPWSTFRVDAQRSVESIVVSHRVQRKLRGAFHEETFFGPTNDEASFVFRKRLDDSFKETDLKRVRDARIRELLRAHLDRQGWKPGAKLPKGAFTGENQVGIPPRDPSDGLGTPVRRVRLTRTMKNPFAFTDSEGHPFRFANLGNNHHLAIASRSESDRRALVARVMTMREAAERVRRRGLDAVDRPVADGLEFEMSLARKESVMVRDPESGADRICIVQLLSGSPDWSTGFDLTLRDARDGRPASEGNRDPYRRLRSFGAKWKELEIRKVTVDPLGRVMPAGD